MYLILNFIESINLHALHALHATTNIKIKMYIYLTF